MSKEIHGTVNIEKVIVRTIIEARGINSCALRDNVGSVRKFLISLSKWLGNRTRAKEEIGRALKKWILIFPFHGTHPHTLFVLWIKSQKKFW